MGKREKNEVPNNLQKEATKNMSFLPGKMDGGFVLSTPCQNTASSKLFKNSPSPPGDKKIVVPVN